MSRAYFFVGPYVECLSSTDIWPQDSDLGQAWDDLLNDRRRLEWNLPWSNTRTIQRDGCELFQYCGVPIEKRPGVPRWPMLFKFEMGLRECESFDWSVADPQEEIAWFQDAYAEELALLRRIFPTPPVLRWGLVYWPR